MIHISEFSGFGGFDLAAQWMGWDNYVSCEINEFCNKIRQYYWPNAYHHKDIKTFTYATVNDELSRRFGAGWRNQKLIITGGFPCQPYSSAGLRKGKEDDRHLWPFMYRSIQEFRPEYVVGENVRGLVNWNGGMVFDEVQADLGAIGYETIPLVLPACAVNAPHRRDRIWFISRLTTDTSGDGFDWHSGIEEVFEGIRNGVSLNESESLYGSRIASNAKSNENFGRRQGRFYAQSSGIGESRVAANTSNPRLQGSKKYGSVRESRQEGEQQSIRLFPSTWEEFPTQSPICTGNDGLSARLDREAILDATGSRSRKGSHYHRWRTESLKAAGNAIVPQVAYQIFKAIQQYEDSLWH